MFGSSKKLVQRPFHHIQLCMYQYVISSTIPGHGREDHQPGTVHLHCHEARHGRIT